MDAYIDILSTDLVACESIHSIALYKVVIIGRRIEQVISVPKVRETCGVVRS